MGLVETCPNIKLNVIVQLNICTGEQNYSLIMKCIIVYIFIIVGRKWLLYFTFTLEIPPTTCLLWGVMPRWQSSYQITNKWFRGFRGTVHGTKFPQKYTCLMIGYFVFDWVQTVDRSVIKHPICSTDQILL